ncbi:MULTISPECIES: sensor histidine kinase [Actinomyces]|uniref:histidine kinase n=1 Tax=Actinomyces respiraculi TaxID=2744574 RepID=A0A7T0LJF4_9ACTO|nr:MULTISPECIES: sensor histidine kinase [Actinomyces]QPL04752.1 sensor histidine kinase [Actinomyces respiraculi]
MSRTVPAASPAVLPTAPGPRPAHPRRPWLHATVVVLAELAHAAAFLPLVALGIFLLLLFPLTLPLAAELERACARMAGATAPSSRLPGHRLWPWLVSRAGQSGFWVRDLPLVVVGLVLSAPSFFIAVSGGTLSAILVALPFQVSAEDPLEVRLVAWSVEIGSPRQGWWLPILGVACFAVTAALLYVLGRLRTRLTQTLSDSSQEERLATLSAEVGHLTVGRATLVDAFDAERARIERDLHDGVQQDLVALTMGLGMTRVRVLSLAEDGQTGALREALLSDLEAAQDRAEAALRALRDTVHGIRPAILTERGLGPALHDLVGRAPLPTSVSVTGAEEHLAALSSPVATAVYFAVCEALTNAARHAGAQARATVRLDVSAEGLLAVVTDDGCGGADPTAAGSTGLAGMSQRLESVGGRLAVDSAPGAGTRLTITAPLTPPWADSTESTDSTGSTERTVGPHPASHPARTTLG